MNESVYIATFISNYNLKFVTFINNSIKNIKFLILLSFLLIFLQGSSQNIQNAAIDKQLADAEQLDNAALSFKISTDLYAASVKNNYQYGILKALSLQAKSKFKVGEISEAKQLYNLLLQNSKQKNNKLFELEGLSGLANIASLNQDYKQAFELYNEALELAKKSNDSFWMANEYSSIAGIMINTKRAAEATKYLHLANDIYKRQNKFVAIATTYTVISAAYIKQANYVDGKLYALDAVHIFESLKAIKHLLEPYINLGLCYDYTNKKDSALYYYNKALCISKFKYHTNSEIDICNNIAVIYDDKHNKDSAKKYYEMALEIAKANQNFEMIALVASNLAEFYAEKIINHEIAYEYQKLAAEANDSLLVIEKRKELNELFVKFETKEVEAKNLILQKENELNKLKLHERNIIVFAFLGFVIILVIGVIFWIKHNKVATKQQMIALELKQLRSQMNPHFLFNSLNSIQHYIINSDIVSANKYLSKFATLIRKTLSLSSESAISLNDEISYLENYLLIEKMRFDEKLEYKINCTKEIDKANFFIPPMIIQPFVENAIYHGLRVQEDKEGLLVISFDKIENTLICTIDDNGIGIQASKKLKENLTQKHISQGINITQQRLALIGKIKKAAFNLTIEDKTQAGKNESGTLVTIKFTL